MANRRAQITRAIQKTRRTAGRAKGYKPPVEGLSGIYKAGFESEKATLGTNRAGALAASRYGQQELTNKYGFGQDPSQNPYSMAAQLQSQLSQANKTSVNSYAGRGQLYSGALTSNALGANTESYNKGYEGLRRGYLGARQKLTEQANQAKNEYRPALTAARLKATTAQLKEDPDATAAPKSPYKKQGFYQQKIRQLRRKRRRL